MNWWKNIWWRGLRSYIFYVIVLGLWSPKRWKSRKSRKSFRYFWVLVAYKNIFQLTAGVAVSTSSLNFQVITQSAFLFFCAKNRHCCAKNVYWNRRHVISLLWLPHEQRIRLYHFSVLFKIDFTSPHMKQFYSKTSFEWANEIRSDSQVISFSKNISGLMHSCKLLHSNSFNCCILLRS